jgi:hypothetical protein
MLCLENVKNEQLRFVLQGLNHTTTVELRLNKREAWANEVSSIRSLQEILIASSKYK